MATGEAEAVVFTAGNLLPVANVLKDNFQEVDIVLVAGHDASNKQITGFTKAKAVGDALAGIARSPCLGLLSGLWLGLVLVLPIAFT